MDRVRSAPGNFLRVALFLVAALLPAAAGAQYLLSPQPGDVYREYARLMTDGDDWRVTDPNIDLGTYPQAGAFLPNPTLGLYVGDLSGAIRAEAVINLWGGHIGTTGKAIRFNGNSWITIPEFGSGNGIPAGTDGYNYITQSDLVIPIPLGHLVEGTNSFQGTNAGQTGPYGFGWGQFGWYSIILRVYYSDSKPHATGSVTSPSGGSTFGENPVVSASVSGGADRVDFLALYDGYDTDGDGVWQEYHHDYAPPYSGSEPAIRNHVGTATGGSWQVTWDTRYVPDQGGIKMLARIRNGDGVWYVTPEVTGLTLQRSGSYVRLYKPLDMPERAWARGDIGEIAIHYNVTDDVSSASEVAGFVRTWNGIDGAMEPEDYNYRRFNDWTDGAYGENHAYSFDIREYPVSALRSGTNEILFYSSNILHHGIEILWPGPGLIVRYGGSAGTTAPSITSHPQSRSVTLGGTTTFSVGASGTPTLRYQWQKNDADIGGATGSSYTIPPAGAGDNGATFRCIVTNDYGSATSNRATLTVGSTSSPAIVRQPRDTTVQLGQTATFSVGATGTPPLSFQWQRNGSDINNAIDSVYTTPPTTLADSGALYRCVVTNGSGSTPSNAARLTVLGSTAPILTRDLVPQLVGMGQRATFIAGVTGIGPFSYRWTRNGQTIGGATDSSYTTPVTVLSDSGALYRCIIRNTQDSTLTSTAMLKVTTGSVSVLANAGFEQGTGSWAFFTNGVGTYTVVPSGAQHPHAARVGVTTEGTNVQLYQSGVVLEAGAQYILFFKAFSSSGHDVALSIQKHGSPFSSYGVSGQVFNLDTTWKDFSVKFTASGFAGVAGDARVMFYLAPYDSAGDAFYFDDVVLAKVSSIAPVRVATQPVNATVTVGDTAVFTMVAGGTPPFSYQWQRNGLAIPGANGPRYVTPAATVGDNGAAFRCLIGNPVADTTTTTATLTVVAGVPGTAPVLLLPANGVSSASTTQQFVWSRGAAGITRTWFEIAADSLFQTQRTVDSVLTDSVKTVTGLVSGTTYWWKVRAGNAAGWGPFSSAWRVRISATDVADREGLPESVTLDQNYPNPFNPSTTIRYSLPVKAAVQLRVYNMLGMEVAVLLNGEREAGYHEVVFDARDLPSGVYFYRLQTGSFSETRRLLLVR